MKGWEHVEHMSLLEKRCASLWFKLDPAIVTGPLTGLVVGECPGKNTCSTLPMFPYPASSSGGRLLKISRLPVETFLGRIRRVNLIETHHEIWPTHTARVRALEIVEENAVKNTRIVLLGAKVGDAFGASRYFDMGEIRGSHYVCIPHPSGLNRAYNDPVVRTGASIALQWCADWQVL